MRTFFLVGFVIALYSFSSAQDEDWSVVASSCQKYFKEFPNDTSDFGSQVNFTYILASAAKTAHEQMSYTELSKALEGLDGKKVKLPEWPIGGRNLYCFRIYCPSTNKDYDVFTIASNREATYMYVMVYANARIDLRKHYDRRAVLRGTIKSIQTNPNQSLAMVLRLYLDPATIELVD